MKLTSHQLIYHMRFMFRSKTILETGARQGCSKVASKPPGAWKISGFLPKAATARRCSGGWQSAADFLYRRCGTVAAQLSRL
jgi:hypothetical protein